MFLYGIENFGREILTLGGPRFQVWLERFTRTRIGGTALGAIVTALIQSSTATTVIVVSLVSGGLITFSQSLPVIFGANIGTTITAQLIAFKVTKIAPWIIIAGFGIGIFGRQYRYLGKGIFYFGLVFFGLGLVSDAVAPIKEDPFIVDTLASFDNLFLALLAGLVFTAIVQSSSVTTGLVVVLAANDMIGLEQGIPILLGTNIGTTATTLIAASRLSLHARRGAIAHTMFNVVGALVMLPFVVPFASLVSSIGGSAAQQVANAHTIFNVVATLIFLLALRPFQRLVERLVKGEEEEIILKTRYLGASLPEDTAEAFVLVNKEIQYSKEVVARLYRKVLEYQIERSSRLINEVEKFEGLSDILDERIEQALLELSLRPLTESQAGKIVALIRLSNAIEQLADIARDQTSLIQSDENPTPGEVIHRARGLIPLHEDLIDVVEQYAQSIPIASNVETLKNRLKAFEPAIDRNYDSHIEHLRQRTPYNSAFFVEFVSLIESSVDKLDELIDVTETSERQDPVGQLAGDQAT